ncbi:hypothetical protein AABB24_029125, partial [Solanum stoloniferum]
RSLILTFSLHSSLRKVPPLSPPSPLSHRRLAPAKPVEASPPPLLPLLLAPLPSPPLPSSPLFPAASSLRRQAAAGLLLLLSLSLSLSLSSLLLSFTPTCGDNNTTAGSNARDSSRQSASSNTGRSPSPLSPLIRRG